MPPGSAAAQVTVRARLSFPRKVLLKNSCPVFIGARISSAFPHPELLHHSLIDNKDGCRCENKRCPTKYPLPCQCLAVLGTWPGLSLLWWDLVLGKGQDLEAPWCRELSVLTGSSLALLPTSFCSPPTQPRKAPGMSQAWQTPAGAKSQTGLWGH